jgi:hypothetical protein
MAAQAQPERKPDRGGDKPLVDAMVGAIYRFNVNARRK